MAGGRPSTPGGGEEVIVLALLFVLMFAALAVLGTAVVFVHDSVVGNEPQESTKHHSTVPAFQPWMHPMPARPSFHH